MTRLQRGRCPVCERVMVLKADGTLRHHGGPIGTGYRGRSRAYCCQGVGQKPAADPCDPIDADAGETVDEYAEVES